MSERQENCSKLDKILEENGVVWNSVKNFYYKLSAPALVAYYQEGGLFQIKSEEWLYTYDLSHPFTVTDVYEDEDFHLPGGVDALFDHIRTTFFPETVKVTV